MSGRLRGGLTALAILATAACSGGAVQRPAAETPTPPALEAPEAYDFTVGRPQNRTGIGDVGLAFDRYEEAQPDLAARFKAQPWFQDGLSRDEALFVERGLAFVASYSGPRRAYIRDETIKEKLYRYERVAMANAEVELLLIYEPGHNADREMAILRSALPALEALVGVEFPERVLTIVNGNFEINDFNNGQFIRIADCCTTSPFVLTHELAHAYWSMGPAWFNEGMADIYANLAIARLNADPPPDWRHVPIDLEAFYRGRKSMFESGRFPDKILPHRLASDGLYEVADFFLLEIRNRIGHEAFAQAARDVYLASDFGRYILRDKRIQDVFLRHTPQGARDGVMTLFNRMVWGDNGERYRELQDLEGS